MSFSIELKTITSSVKYVDVNWNFEIDRFKTKLTSPSPYEDDRFPLILELNIGMRNDFTMKCSSYRHLNALFCMFNTDDETFMVSKLLVVSENVWYNEVLKFIPSEMNQGYGKLVKYYLKFRFIIVEAENSPFLNDELLDDYKKILDDQLYCDVIMKSDEGVNIQANKSILASRSPVLASYFVNSIEGSTKYLLDSPLSTEVLQETLLFIYTNRCPKIDEIPEKLLAAAAVYKLNGMKKACEYSLKKKLSPDNAIETLKLAELHSADNLLEATLDFIKLKKNEIIKDCDAWNNFESTELLKKILIRIVK